VSNKAETLLDLAINANALIATAESCTAGLISAEITSAAGSSAIFDRGFATYTNAAKIELLDVSPDTIARHGAVSEETAREMADGAMKHSDASLTVSVTGIAGPGGSEFKPEGRVCFGLARKNAETVTQTIEFGAIGRESVRRATVDHALDLLIAALKRDA